VKSIRRTKNEPASQLILQGRFFHSLPFYQGQDIVAVTMLEAPASLKAWTPIVRTVPCGNPPPGTEELVEFGGRVASNPPLK
jgi:hypothetical protein